MSTSIYIVHVQTCMLYFSFFGNDEDFSFTSFGSVKCGSQLAEAILLKRNLRNGE